MNIPETVCDSKLGGVVTSGGGFSLYYPILDFQKKAIDNYFIEAKSANQTPTAGYSTGRGYPDISLPGHHYYNRIGGNWHLVSGTSASAPTAAGMFSTINAARYAVGKGSLGWINPVLYANASVFANDITSGDNKCVQSGLCCAQGYNAAPGWDPATGLGSINFGKLQTLLVSLGNVNGALYPPSFTPTASPTRAPTESPTSIPTATSTASPTNVPTSKLTSSPTFEPMSMPMTMPSTASPTAKPTRASSSTSSTSSPTSEPSRDPTASILISPTDSPSLSPTVERESNVTFGSGVAGPSSAPTVLLKTNFRVQEVTSFSFQSY